MRKPKIGVKVIKEDTKRTIKQHFQNYTIDFSGI
jgi:hypothetical protein